MTVPATLVTQLQAELAAMPDPLDVPLRQFTDFETKRSSLRARIESIRRAESMLAELEPLIAADTKWRDQVVSWRKTLCEELLALPPRDPRAHGLKLSINQIDRGFDFWNEAFPARIRLDDLMAAAGYEPDGRTLAATCGACWRGNLLAVEERLRALQKRRDEAQARLDAALRDE